MWVTTKSLVSALAAGLFTVSATASTVMVQSHTVALPELSQSYDFDDPASESIFLEAIIAGLPKFDPSVGTLTRISVDVNANFTHEMGVGATDVTGPGEEHSAEFATEFTEIEIIYNTGNVGFVVGSYGLSDALDCFGDGGEPCSNYEIFDDVWAEAEVGGTDITTLDSPNAQYDPSDFIGTADVEALELLFVAYQINTMSQNADGVYVEQKFLLDAGDLVAGDNTFTINYEYSPVPLPAAVWLFAGALVGVVTLSRRR